MKLTTSLVSLIASAFCNTKFKEVRAQGEDKAEELIRVVLEKLYTKEELDLLDLFPETWVRSVLNVEVVDKNGSVFQVNCKAPGVKAPPNYGYNGHRASLTVEEFEKITGRPFLRYVSVESAIKLCSAYSTVEALVADHPQFRETVEEIFGETFEV